MKKFWYQLGFTLCMVLPISITAPYKLGFWQIMLVCLLANGAWMFIQLNQKNNGK